MNQYFYMVVSLNTYPGDDYPIIGTYFFNSIYEARVCAYAETGCPFFLDTYYEVYSNIYKIPYGQDITFGAGDGWINLKYDYHEYLVEKIRYKKVIAAETIQKYYRLHLLKKTRAVKILQRRIREAIANPYTELCRKRLLREFNEMVWVI